jgi:hypothetical protein
MSSLSYKDTKEYKQAKKEADIKYKRHSLYKSLFIHKRYKELSGKIIPSNKGAERWLKEKWISVDDYLDGKIVVCGNAKENTGCRPSIRINKDTPITIEETLKKHGKKKVRELSNIKKKNPDNKINWKDGTYIIKKNNKKEKK